MNNITKAILEYYDLKVEQRFTIDNCNYKGVYYFNKFGELLREKGTGFENVSREILGRLAYGITIFKLERFEAQKKTVKDLKDGDNYYYLNSLGEVRIEYWDDDEIDHVRLSFGNAFITEQEARFELERIKIEAKLLKYGRREFSLSRDNYYFEFDTSVDELSIPCFKTLHTMNNIYFDTEELAEKALKEVGEEKIKKYFFGVDNESNK